MALERQSLPWPLDTCEVTKDYRHGWFNVRGGQLLQRPEC